MEPAKEQLPQPLTSLNLAELKTVMKDWDEPAYRSTQLLNWLYRHNIMDFCAISNFPHSLLDKLKKSYVPCSLIAAEEVSTDRNNAIKHLFRTVDDNLIEGVAITEDDRFTLCISSQIGCAFSCKFCASGASGFIRDLTAGEMIDQIRIMVRDRQMTNLVFMGSGEPLQNFVQFSKAYEIITAEWGLHLGQRKITVSTAGFIPGIKQLIESDMRPKLALSLHSAFDEKRVGLMPITKKYPIKNVLESCSDYAHVSGRKITVEYIVIPSFNDTFDDAKAFAKLLKSYPAKVNLIPLNPVKEFEYPPPKKRDVSFFSHLLDKHGLDVTIRWSKGSGISAACGQLRARRL